MKYQPTRQEQNLRNEKIDISRLTILQRKSLTRLQFFSFRHKNFIRSINDQFKNLRIIVLSLFVKFYSEYSQKNLKRLNIIKQILYESNLETLIHNKGLQKQQLHKCVCVQLEKLTVGFEVQSHLINMFNCVAFFDQIILRSIQQKFISMGSTISIQIIQKWMQSNLEMKIIWNAQDLQQQKQDQLFLWKDQQNLYRQSSANMIFVQQSEQTSSNNQNQPNRSNIKQKTQNQIQSNQKKTASKMKLFQTISVASSISPFQNDQSSNVGSASKYRNNAVNPFFNGNHQHNYSQDQSKQFLFHQNQKQIQRELIFHQHSQGQGKKHILKLQKSKNQNRSFFSLLFCCGCQKQNENEKNLQKY